MVGAGKQARLLGTVLLTGSVVGVGLSTIGVTLLALIGERADPWPLVADGWWTGEYAVIEFLVGIGILVLAATPVVMLSVYCAQAVRQRRYKSVLLACGLLAILACGLLMNVFRAILFSQPF